MAPHVSLARAGRLPAAAGRPAPQRAPRAVAAHATGGDAARAAAAAMAAGIVLATSGGPAAAAPPPPLAPPAAEARLPERAPPGIARAASGPPANMEDPDSYFDALEGGARAAPALAVKYVEAGRPVRPLATLADLNADVRGAAGDYRDPAIATPQDKVADALSGASTPDVGVDLGAAGDKLSGAADDAAAKAKSMFGSGSSSAAPVRPLATLADLNADVRGAAGDYRDPAIATPQDKVADALSGASTPDVGVDLGAAGDKLSGAADDAAAKAKSMFGSGSSSAAPVRPLATLADLNADVRGAAGDYRDPAIATPQDKVADALSGASTPDVGVDLGAAGDKLSGAADDAAAKAKSMFGSGSSSAAPVRPLATLADLNADVRGAAGDYRDPAIATPQDKVADALSGASTPDVGVDLGAAGDKLSGAADDAAAKAKSMFGSGSSSAAPVRPLATLADLNADVRDAASDYRDPAGAVQQDNATDAARDAGARATSAYKEATSTAPVKKLAKRAARALKPKPGTSAGVGAGYGASGRVRDSAGVLRNADDLRGPEALPVGNARLSRPLVRDSLGVRRDGATNETGAAGAGGRGLAKRVADKLANAACRAASGGHVWKGDSIYGQLEAYLQVNGPVLRLPRNATDITTAATILQLAAPGLKLVLDPLLYLQLLPEPRGVPRVIHMTLRDKRALAPHQLLCMLSWGRRHAGWALLLYDDADMAAYMERYFPALMPTFRQLATPVEKSDAWRYAVLCGHGGVYTDTDTVAAARFEDWTSFNATPEPGLIVGLENRFYSQQEAEEESYVHETQVTQWTIAAKRAHPVVCRMGAAIKAFVEREAADGNALEAAVGHDAAILLRTGPGIWSTEVHRFLEQMGSSAREVAPAGGVAGDLVVLPVAAFGCNFRYWNVANRASLVYHMYNNSWKVDHFRVADAKRAARRAGARAAALRTLYPLLGVLLAACALLGALYAWLGGGAPGGPHAGARRKRRAPPVAAAPFAGASAGAGGAHSPRGSPCGSPARGGGAAVTTSSSSRLQQQLRTMRRLSARSRNVRAHAAGMRHAAAAAGAVLVACCLLGLATCAVPGAHVAPAAADAPTQDCNGLEGDQLQGCVNAFVDLLRAAEGLEACGVDQRCIDQWVNAKHLLTTCGLMLADCACLETFPPPDMTPEERAAQLRACLNGWVLTRQAELAAATCGTAADARARQECLNAWAEARRVEETPRGGPEGGRCPAGPPAARQACVDAWANTKMCQQRGITAPTCAGACARRTSPAARRACVNDWLLGQAWLAGALAPRLHGGRPCVARTWNSTAPRQRCLDSYVVGRAMARDPGALVRLGPLGDGVDCRTLSMPPRPGQPEGQLDATLAACAARLLEAAAAGDGGDERLAACFAVGAPEGAPRRACVRAWVQGAARRDTWWRIPFSWLP
ncbi:HOC1 [Scenedesmus sp. PABB004]|nr:HOC1 [Scenedesmus sp. PABB004]